MTTDSGPELIFIRHAAAETGGRLCGRTDVPLRQDVQIARRADAPGRLVTSPALRCRQTAKALWPGRPFEADPRLWEQDFGDWDGTPAADLPDLGPLPTEALAAHCPPGGESFAELCHRTWPALRDLAGAPTTVVAHAGTIRAALALALGTIPPALMFEVPHLSVTRLRVLPEGQFSVVCVGCPG